MQGFPFGGGAKPPARYRRHRFPQLNQDNTELDDLDALGHPDDAGMDEEEFAINYEEELARGYREGFAKGEQEGKDQGLQLGQKSGYNQGLLQGQDAGKEAAYHTVKQELSPVLAPVAALHDELQQRLKETLVTQRDAICQLVSQVTRQVLRAELSLQPTQILKLIDDSLQLLPKPHESIEIHLDPMTVAALQQLAPEQIKDWQLQGDETLSQGSFRIVTSNAEAESHINERVDQAVAQVADELAKS